MNTCQYPQPPVNTDDAWHAWRAQGIGASEAAAALGISPYQSPFELYQRKIGALAPIAENDAMALGKLQEPVIAAMYFRKTGRQITRTQVTLETPDLPFLRATIDGFDEDEVPVEFKTANIRQLDDWGPSETDEIPDHYLCQVHHQLIVTGAPFARLALLLAGSEFRVYTIEANQRIADRLINDLGEFWNRVQTRNPPPATLADNHVVARLFPRIEATIELGWDAQADADDYALIGDKIKGLQEARDATKARLILAMADHSAASLPDGTTITRKPVNRKAYSVAESTYIDMRFKKPKGR